MTDNTPHLDDWLLGQMAEGMLSGPELETAEVHLEGCARCAAELEGYRALYAALGDLPRFAPSPDFGDRVMARVRLPEPSPALAWLQRWVPKSRRGWVILVAALVAPVLPLLGMVAWVITHPGVSFGSLVQGAALGAQALGASAFEQVVEWAIETGAVGLVMDTFEAAQAVPLTTAVGALVLAGLVIQVSAWSLFRLVRTPMRNATYAS